MAILVTLLVTLAAFAPQVVSAADPSSGDWPLAKGAYWVYEGNVTWFNTDTQQEVKEKVTWKVEVTDVVQRDHVTAYVLKGALDDLANYEAGAKPGDYVIIQVGADKFYQANNDALMRLTAADNADDPLVGLIMPELQLLELPLYKGKVFGDPQQITRPDHMYAWWVTDVKPADVTGIQGVPSGTATDQYVLSLMTTSDNTTQAFVPGLGIVQYSYVHNGTPAEAAVRLVEFHAGQ
jgi:hypothetical protein